MNKIFSLIFVLLFFSSCIIAQPISSWNALGPLEYGNQCNAGKMWAHWVDPDPLKPNHRILLGGKPAPIPMRSFKDETTAKEWLNSL